MTEDLLNTIIDYLKKHDIDAYIKEDGIISFFLTVSGQKFEALCDLRKGFPYSLPLIQASDELFEVIKDIPHVSYWKNICTYDEATTIPNYDHPERIVFSCIDKAIKIINDGLLCLNEEDYIDELKAYWENKNNIDTYYLLGDVKEYVDYFWYKDDIISPSKRMLGSESKRGLVLHTNFIYKGNRSFKFFINKCVNEKERKRLSDFIGTNISNSHFIMIENVINNKSMYLGLKTPVYKNIKNGFRPGKINIITAVNLFKEEQFIPVNINNATHDYLYKRGGDGATEKISKVCVVGCGSFGGYLCELLMDYGVREYFLIDKEFLTSDNIARHLCGFRYRELSKTEAVGNFLVSHNPNIVFKYKNMDIHNVLDDSVNELNECDYIFICTGDLGVEKRFCELIKGNIIKKPVVIVWAEPFCLACHATIINKPSEVFSLIYNSNMEFLYSVVSNSDSFYKREHGCRSTYIPYSSYMVKHFLIELLLNILKSNRLEDDNYSFIWFGDLNKACEVGATISDSFSNSSSFSYIIRKIS